ncbi:MAG: hypothetical protein E6K54_06210 [Gammaproteobacteria bacterium]|nr:MAG: hypothetical protein E6K54_06210 [Gammaproteobacteria bacterium]
MKTQPSSDWKEIKIDELDALRDGERNYTFHGKEFTKLFIPSWLPSFSRSFIELPYIKGKTSSGAYLKKNLDELLVSKQKLDDLGITKFLDLDLESIPEVTTQEQEAAHEARMEEHKIKVQSQYLKKSRTSLDWFDDMLSKGQKSIQARKTAHSKSRLARASIFGEPSAGASASESGEVNEEKLTKEVSKLTL